MFGLKLFNFIKDFFSGTKTGIIFILWISLIIPILFVASIVYFVVSLVSTSHDMLMHILNDKE
jgi:hypothetical protein